MSLEAFLLTTLDAVKIDVRCIITCVLPCRMYNKRKICSCAQTGKCSQSMRSCIQHKCTHASALPAISLQHPSASKLLIDALDPETREWEMQVLATVSCLVSAILSNVSALSGKRSLLDSYLLGPSNASRTMELMELIKYSKMIAKDSNCDGIPSDLVRCCAMTSLRPSPRETQTSTVTTCFSQSRPPS
jgi:hypothetical protein